jgi:hypothetical protein
MYITNLVRVSMAVHAKQEMSNIQKGFHIIFVHSTFLVLEKNVEDQLDRSCEK